MKVNSIIFFDGICIFCSDFAAFVVKRDNKKFRFCTLQSEVAEQLSIRYNFVEKRKNLDSLILLKDEKIFLKTEAVIEILYQLGGVWRIAVLLRLLPLKLRDFGYDFFAKNRYRWFGKKSSCEINVLEIRERIVADGKQN